MKNSQLLEHGYTKLRCNVDIHRLNEFRERQSKILDLVGVQKHEGIRLPYAFKISPSTIDVFGIFDKLKDVISTALETEQWVLTGHSDLHRNALSGWHRDDGTSYGDGGYFGKPNPDYTTNDLGVYKVAVYLQEHQSFEDGITIECGSHIRTDRNLEDVIYMPTDLGEVLIFDQRLFHTGQLEKFPRPITENSIGKVKEIPGIVFGEKNKVISFSEAALNQFRKIRGDRMSVFFTVRLSSVEKNHPSVIFEKNNMKRQLFELATVGRYTATPTSIVTPLMLEYAKCYGINYSSELTRSK